MTQAFFGPPLDDDQPGGGHVALYVVPVVEGDLIAFDITDNPTIEGRWLPWTILPWRGNPYETAALLADAWCGVDVHELAPVDVLSFVRPGDIWELALIFRAELGAVPEAGQGREVARIAPDAIEKIQTLEAVELRRWVIGSGAAAPRRGPDRGADSGLVF